MIDESTDVPPPPPVSPETTARRSGEPTVAFCQQCGRGLTRGGVRTVGTSVFCELCAATPHGFPSTESAPGATAAGYSPVRGPVQASAAAGPATPRLLSGEPNPLLAGFLGFIPGVGAMYNGQYPKGVIHLVIFVVLTSLADNLNWVLWWFVWGWIFYQAFEAYHTAQARRDGLPLPDPFGWNDLGDRLGFGRTRPPVSSPARSASWANAAPSPAAQAANPAAQASFQAAQAASPAAQADNQTAPYPAPPVWPSNAAETPSPGTDAFATATSWTAPTSAGFSNPGTEPLYSPTYTGVPASTGPPLVAPVTSTPRFPAGAAWLIGLGVLFLIGNLAPAWRIDARWLVPALLAMVAFWTGGRKVQATLKWNRGTAAGGNPLWLEGLLGPVILLTVAVLLALQNASVVPLRHSWPAILIVWGALLLIGRARLAGAPPIADAASPAPDASSPENSPLR